MDSFWDCAAGRSFGFGRFYRVTGLYFDQFPWTFVECGGHGVVAWLGIWCRIGT